MLCIVGASVEISLKILLQKLVEISTNICCNIRSKKPPDNDDSIYRIDLHYRIDFEKMQKSANY